MELKGTVTALVTPFKNGEPDLNSLGRLVEHQLARGIHGLLACGCTGEPATLSDTEKLAVVEGVLETVQGRLSVIAGTGTNSTASTVEFTRKVSRMGVDAVLVITPYYNKPTPPGQMAHFSRAADASEKPLVIYNVPGRTGTCMTTETLAALGEHPNIIGVKDAAGSVERVTELRRISSMAYMSGDDHLALAQVFMGASGVVSVTSNAAPALMSEMIQSGLQGEVRHARDIHERLFPLFRALFSETNPAPVKKALQLMGIIGSDSLREPLVQVQRSTSDLLTGVLSKLELL